MARKSKDILLAGAFALASLAFEANAQVIRAPTTLPNVARVLSGLTSAVTLSVVAPTAQGAGLNYEGASQVVSSAGYVQFPANPMNGVSAWAEVTFTGAAGKGYVVDCGVTGANSISMGVQIGGNSVNPSSTTPVNGRASVLVPAQPNIGARRVMVAGQGAVWRFTGCTITPT